MTYFDFIQTKPSGDNSGGHCNMAFRDMYEYRLLSLVGWSVFRQSGSQEALVPSEIRTVEIHEQ